jgi:hypothetical protein
MDADFRHTTWNSESMPYLMFLPRFNPFYGPLFGRLNHDKRSLPMNSQAGWTLTDELIYEWQALESLLRIVMLARQELGVHAYAGLTAFAWPRCFGYMAGPRRSHYAMASVALRLHDAFLPLMAATTLMLVLLDTFNDKSWRDHVMETTKVHPQWLADLESSAVGNPRTEHVSVIIDMTHSDLPQRTRSLDLLLNCVVAKLPVPLYFYWGEHPNLTSGLIDAVLSLPPIPTCLKEKKFFPDMAEADYLHSLSGRVAFSPWDCEETPYTSRRDKHGQRAQYTRTSASSAKPSPAPPFTTSSPSFDDPAENVRRVFPPVERHSGQKEGEDVHAFIARRNTQNEIWEAKEPPDAKKKRLARAAHAATGEPPSKKGARVFVWEEEDGFFIRKAVSRANVADTWEEFTHNQRRYDDFSDQWDLCTAFAPEEEAGSDDDGKGYEGPFYPNLEFPEYPGIPDAVLPKEPIQEHSTENDLQRVYSSVSEELSEIDRDDHEPSHNVKDVPSSRFGFLNPITPGQYGVQLRSDFCCRSVGDEFWADSKNLALLPAFLEYLVEAKSLEDVPEELLDLRQDGTDICGLWAVDVE